MIVRVRRVGTAGLLVLAASQSPAALAHAVVKASSPASGALLAVAPSR